MILVAVIVGYVLGSAPIIYKEIKEIIKSKQEENLNEKSLKENQELLDEWLNGPKKTATYETNNNQSDKGVNQVDIYNEYITGNVSSKED